MPVLPLGIFTRLLQAFLLSCFLDGGVGQKLNSEISSALNDTSCEDGVDTGPNERQRNFVNLLHREGYDRLGRAATARRWPRKKHTEVLGTPLCKVILARFLALVRTAKLQVIQGSSAHFPV